MTRPTPSPPWTTTGSGSDPSLHRADAATTSPGQGQAGGTDPGVGERHAAQIRRLVIDRLIEMNANHARAAWTRRRRDPIEPHGIALLYTQDNPRSPYRVRVTAATRLWVRDEHRWDVHRRIYRWYSDLAVEPLLAHGGDVRALTDRRDEQMSDDARYVGVAVSSLDTSTGSWDEVTATAQVTTTDTRPRTLWGRTDEAVTARPAPAPRAMPVEDDRDIPGAIRIVLIDGTVIVGERRGRPDFEHKILLSTHSLNFGPHDSPYPWGCVSAAHLDDDPVHGEVLHWLRSINELCWRADAARAETGRRGTRGGHR